MSRRPRRRFSDVQKTIAELTSEYGVHANQISIWKKQLLDAAPPAFSNRKDKDAEKKEVERDHLYQKIGQLQIEVDWLNTSNAFTGASKDHDVQISMDGIGRCMDNIFIERLWRSVKYKKIFLEEFETAPELLSGL
jgi:transposase-like protein